MVITQKLNTMAHKKGVGSSKNGRESESKRLGVKIYGGQGCLAGNILVRQEEQRTIQVKMLEWVKDHTLFALVDGTVVLLKRKIIDHLFQYLRLQNKQRVIEKDLK